MPGWNICCVFFFFNLDCIYPSLKFFLRQGFIMGLALNYDPPTSASWVLGLQARTTTLGLLYFACVFLLYSLNRYLNIMTFFGGTGAWTQGFALVCFTTWTILLALFALVIFEVGCLFMSWPVWTTIGIFVPPCVVMMTDRYVSLCLVIG
jgi:hypothetical protein